MRVLNICDLIFDVAPESLLKSRNDPADRMGLILKLIPNLKVDLARHTPEVVKGLHIFSAALVVGVLQQCAQAGRVAQRISNIDCAQPELHIRYSFPACTKCGDRRRLLLGLMIRVKQRLGHAH